MMITPSAAAGSASMASSSAPACAAGVTYHEVAVDSLRIAYREAGSRDDPTILLLHGVPSSSRMYDSLMRKLGGCCHMVALDYPGFGNSDAPPPDRFTYTFDRLADVVMRFADSVGLKQYVLFMQDYGAPIGMRVAHARPAAVAGMIFQNGNIYEEGLAPFWEKRRAYWQNRAAHEQEVRDGHLALAGIRARHVGTDPNVLAYDPDLWMDEHAYLNRPGQAAIQAELIYDYRTNIAAYPAWQAWLRAHRPPMLVMWGRHDLAFTTDGATAFKRDVPDAQVVILDAGHFAIDTKLNEVAELTEAFMRENPSLHGQTLHAEW